MMHFPQCQSVCGCFAVVLGDLVKVIVPRRRAHCSWCIEQRKKPCWKLAIQGEVIEIR